MFDARFVRLSCALSGWGSIDEIEREREREREMREVLHPLGILRESPALVSPSLT